MLTFAGLGAKTWRGSTDADQRYYEQKVGRIDAERDPNQYNRNIQKRDDAIARAEAERQEKAHRLNELRTETERVQGEINALEQQKRAAETATQPLQRTYDRIKRDLDTVMRSEAKALNALQTAILRGYDTATYEERYAALQRERQETHTAFLDAKMELEPARRQLDGCKVTLAQRKGDLGNLQRALILVPYRLTH